MSKKQKDWLERTAVGVGIVAADQLSSDVGNLKWWGAGAIVICLHQLSLWLRGRTGDPNTVGAVDTRVDPNTAG